MLAASPAYLARRGVPVGVRHLPAHACIRDTNMRGDGSWPLTEGEKLHRVTVSGRFLVNSARMTRDLAVEGEGIALCPDYAICDDLAAGRLTNVLPAVCGPVLDVHAVYLGQRRVARRARALLDFLVQNVAGSLASAPETRT